MAFEAMNAVFKAEAEAAKILDNARETARLSLRKADDDALKLSNEIRAEAERKAQEIRKAAEDEAREQAKPLLAKAAADAKKLREVDQGKRAKAVSYVVNEVMRYGDR